MMDLQDPLATGAGSEIARMFARGARVRIVYGEKNHLRGFNESAYVVDRDSTGLLVTQFAQLDGMPYFVPWVNIREVLPLAPQQPPRAHDAGAEDRVP